MIVKHINPNSFDIFYNQGWDNWARFSLTPSKIVQVAGNPVPKNIFLFLAKRYGK